MTDDLSAEESTRWERRTLTNVEPDVTYTADLQALADANQSAAPSRASRRRNKRGTARFRPGRFR